MQATLWFASQMIEAERSSAICTDTTNCGPLVNPWWSTACAPRPAP